VKYYFKTNIKAEPLMWNWYAWSYLIPPITSGCNIIERHLRIMQSYIQFPKIHEQAVKTPAMMGGPFMDLDDKYVSLVKDLITKTEKDCKVYIGLSNDFKEFKKLLQKEAIGNSLEPFYTKIPQSLKGLVELVYDIENHPQVLLIEKLIYNQYYSTQGQSISLSPLESDERPFTMSTPRVITNNELNIKTPFIDSVWDELFKAKQQPIDVKKLAIKLNITGDDIRYFESLFTDEPPQDKKDRNYNGEGIRVRYLGHATILLQTNYLSIITDPVISYDIPGLYGSRYTYNDLPDVIDYVLLTHNHQDHIMFESLLQIRHKVKTILVPRNRKGALEDPSIKLILNQIGFTSVIEIDNLESIDIPDGEIIGIPFLGEHSDLNIQTKTAYFVKLQNKKFLFAADSNNLSPQMYEYLFDYLNSIDVLFLGMECDGAPLTWLYGPLLSQPLKRSFDNERKLSGSNCERAWALAKISKCSQAYVYAMGMEPWLTYIMALQYKKDSIQIIESNKFVETCKENNIQSEILFMKKEWIM
jgi:L-ascorbate metabolism protein UlaG (beta-lactamase superfamily)